MKLKISSAVLLALSLLANPAFAKPCGRLCDKSFMKQASPAAVKSLLKAGAKVNARDILGGTPLHGEAAFNKNPKVLVTLLKAGAKVNARDILGGTPLHRAARYNKNPRVLATLLKAGAKVNARDKDGKTAWDYAQKNKALQNTPAYWRLNDRRFKR